MRHIDLGNLLQTIFATPEGKKDKKRLDKAHKIVITKPGKTRPAYIDSNGVRQNLIKGRADYIEDNGASKWTPLKDRFTALLGNKCWYTEAELVGAPLTIDHYRPRCDYWFLAFKAENYRVACPFANSPKDNPLYGCSGGKGDSFPLLDERNKAHGAKRIIHERPIILDPCNEEDCKLIAFQPDGRPVIHPEFASDSNAIRRLEKSKLLLNLDHPDFNSKREQLHDEIKAAVEDHEAFPQGSDRRNEKRSWLREKLSPTAPFSVAARHYLSAHRHLHWVEDILNPT